MGRAPKPHIPLNPLIMRYLEDIEDGFQARQEDKDIQPRESFLIHTLLQGETYPKDHDKALVAFKKYFAKEKVLSFPNLADFSKRYGFNWKATDVVESAQTSKSHFVSFEKFFPVKVLDIKKVSAFSAKYKNSKAVQNEVDVGTEETDCNFITKTLSKEGLVPYTFQPKDTQSWKIFRRLWERRRHTIAGKIKHPGEEDTFDNFVAKIGVADRDALRGREYRKRQEQKVRNVIKSITRKDNFPLRLTCGKSRVLLTVRD